MRLLWLTVAAGLVGSSSAMAEVPDDLFTVTNAILCINADNLEIARHPAVTESQLVLRAMGCFRTAAGIRARLLEGSAHGD